MVAMVFRMIRRGFVLLDSQSIALVLLQLDGSYWGYQIKISER